MKTNHNVNYKARLWVDEKIRKSIISFLRSKNGYMNPDEDFEFKNKWLVWLEKQKEQKPAEWSKEDEEMLYAVVDMVSNSLYEPLYPREGMIAWLKSLRPQPYWKPSEEQMEELNKARLFIPYNCDILESLYEHLKKL